MNNVNVKRLPLNDYVRKKKYMVHVNVCRSHSTMLKRSDIKLPNTLKLSSFKLPNHMKKQNVTQISAPNQFFEEHICFEVAMKNMKLCTLYYAKTGLTDNHHLNL
ncbi:hypothetical protein Cni_G04921 [Canna indica]|uniref:Uncharacterized protein n=1 Tax=Canna indica TaxID=4628 RepID=A0AAQ3JTL6_9LILI|nr:hypothetical protein Cni_G04921 [Canna indica]